METSHVTDIMSETKGQSRKNELKYKKIVRSKKDQTQIQLNQDNKLNKGSKKQTNELECGLYVSKTDLLTHR